MGVSPQTSTPNGGTPCTPTRLNVPPAQQWATTTPSRATTDSYSWLQAVHWVHGAGIAPTPTRGPKFGDTTIRIARILADLTPCRPSIAYLMRRTGLSERTVQYHLALLRSAGLLAYVVKGSRRKGATALASEFARVIPPAFDTALGIRCVGEGVDRRPVGIAEHGRKLIAKLAKKATRKTRRRAAKKPSAARVRCTPMQGGASTSSTAGTTWVPSENKLASGNPKSPTPKKPTRGPRKLNDVGRSWQLAGQLIRQVPWLDHAAPARIAWIVRHVAKAGWTADEVIAWLDLGKSPDAVYRPSGFLAKRLALAVHTWSTPETRHRAVAEHRERHRIRQARTVEVDIEGTWRGPSNPAVAARVMDGIRHGLANYTARQQATGLDVLAPVEPAVEDDPATADAAFAAFLGTAPTNA